MTIGFERIPSAAKQVSIPGFPSANGREIAYKRKLLRTAATTALISDERKYRKM
jgi:hypothetical protein